MDEEGAEVAIPALRHPEEGCLPTGRMLAGDKAQPRGKLAPIFERGGIADCRDQGCRGQGANPRQLRQPLTGLVALEHALDLLSGGSNTLIQGLELLSQRL